MRANAKGFIEVLLKYEAVLTAQIFLCIFGHTSLLSKHISTREMDILTAQCLVEGTEDSLKKCARNFEVKLREQLMSL